MKNLQLMSWGLALAALTACVNLDEQLVGTVTTTYFTTPAGLEAAVDGDYAQLRDFFGREESFAVTEFGTDLTTNGDQGGYQFENTYAGGLNASAGHYRFPWESFYRGIHAASRVGARAPAVTGMHPAVEASRIAEAKFLRALSYFWLVQMYGPVPLPLTESQGASNQAHRSPVDSVYLQIVQDLRDAIPDLPATQSQFGRATKGAAHHLLAKVLLTRAYHPFAYEAANTGFYLSGPTFQREASATAATDFAAARAEADSVIAGPYALMPNYVDVYCAPMGARGPGSYCNVPSNENNSEIIFSVQFTTTAGQFNVAGDTAIFQPGHPVGQAVRQAAKYAIYEPCVTEPCPNQTTVGQYDIFRFPTMKKWQDDARPDFNNLDGGRDIILMRLGETYLIAAEAALGAGDEPGALAYLVTLRQRAANCRGCPAEAANRALIVDATHMPATIDLEYIMDERGRELYGELTRWLDLARTGLWHRIVDDNWQASQAHGGFFNEAKHHLRPIPQSQIDLTAGGTRAFPQNPGY